MSSKSIMPLDTFTVVNKTILNDSDRNILITLYQPIIGTISVNFYLNLWSYLDKIAFMSDTIDHNRLISLMGITFKELLEAREKLEGIGLLKTYVKEGEINNYVYELYSPLQAKEFFVNPLLTTVLYTTVGSVEYKRIKELYKLPTIDLKDYVNISKKFSDVYKSTSLINSDSDNIRKKNYIDLSINSNLDIDNILMTIPDIMLNHTKIEEEVKSLILKLSYVYNFNEEDTINVIKNSIDDKHNIDIKLLKKNYQNYYQFENSGKLPSIVYRTQPDNLKHEVTSNTPKAKMIYMFENVSPYKFVCNKSKTDKPTKAELEILEYLLIDMNLKPGVVNVLIDYVLKINNNKLSKNFIVAIASQWKRSNIELVEDAMKFAHQEYKNRTTIKTKTTVTKVESKPEWFDKKIEEDIDLEKQKKIEEMLNGV